MLQALKVAVCEANLELRAQGLVVSTFGNVSGIDRKQGVVVIKASGVSYDGLGPDHMVAVNLEDGEVMGSDLRPSSDTPTHLVLYRAFSEIGGVAHTHSPWATAWAQARKGIPAMGTTHADYFHGEIPCTDRMTDEEIGSGYEVNTGDVIVRRFEGIDPIKMPAALVAEHGPFTWGRTAADAVHHALILEHVAATAHRALALSPEAKPISQALLNKHFLRKHGPEAYYGQDGDRG